jgi:hypothetical protein
MRGRDDKALSNGDEEADEAKEVLGEEEFTFQSDDDNPCG